MKPKSTIIIILLLAFQFSNLIAQDLANPLEPVQVRMPILLGPVVGYNRSVHTADIASFVDDPLCPFFTNGTANGFYVGFSFEYLLGSAVDSRSSLIARVLYNTMPADFEKEGDKHPSLVEDLSQSTGYRVVESTTRHAIEVAFSTLTAEVCYKFNFLEGLGVTVGPTFDIPLSKSMTQVYQLLEPNYVQFKRNQEALEKGEIVRYEDNDRTIVVYDQDVPEASGFRLGLKAGLQYEIILGKRYYIVPAFYYNYAVTKFSSVENWFVHAIQFGVDIRFSL